MLCFVLINSVILNLLCAWIPKLIPSVLTTRPAPQRQRKVNGQSLPPTSPPTESLADQIPFLSSVVHVVSVCCLKSVLSSPLVPPYPFSPSLISLTVSVDHAYLSACCHWTRRVIYIAWLRYQQNRSREMYSPARRKHEEQFDRKLSSSGRKPLLCFIVPCVSLCFVV